MGAVREAARGAKWSLPCYTRDTTYCRASEQDAFHRVLRAFPKDMKVVEGRLNDTGAEEERWTAQREQESYA
jgi:hypothetical protein